MKKIIKINQWYAKNSSHTCPPTSPRAVKGKGVVPTAATKSLESLLFSADFKEGSLIGAGLASVNWGQENI